MQIGKRERKRLYSIVSFLSRLGLKETDYLELETTPNLKDYVWDLMMKTIHINSENFSVQAMVYFSMAVFAKSEGVDPIPFLELHHQATLLSASDSSIQLQATIIANPLCQCAYLSGFCLNVNVAMKKGPLPIVSCPNGLCTAEYAIVPKRDADGFLLRRPKIPSSKKE